MAQELKVKKKEVLSILKEYSKILDNDMKKRSQHRYYSWLYGASTHNNNHYKYKVPVHKNEVTKDNSIGSSNIHCSW